MNLSIGGENVVSSKIGFICTLLTAGVSLAFGFSRFNKLVTKSDPQINQFKEGFNLMTN